MKLMTHCPVCNSQIKEPLEFCRRCSAHLLLLIKIRREAERLKKANKLLILKLRKADMIYKFAMIKDIFESL